MRIVVHDFIGLAFPVQLSRELAQRGHAVLHLHFPAFETPKGDLGRQPGDPPTLAIEGITIPTGYDKYKFVKRIVQEFLYARRCAERILSFSPDVVLSADATPNIQAMLLLACRRRGIKFIPWVQDFQAVAVGRMLRKKIGPIFGRLIGWFFEALDRRVLEKSDRVIFITPRFYELAATWNGVVEKASVIENWAPISHLPVRPKANPWSCKHGLSDKKVLLYAGTLGLKHNPEVLIDLASHFAAEPEVRTVVLSQGPGREWLEKRKSELGLDGLLLMDYVDFQDLPDVLAAGDVLMALLEDAAGDVSVPSKVLAYCCAERPLLVRVPEGNRAGTFVHEARGGIVLHSNDTVAFLKAAERLLDDAPYAAECSRKARLFAEAQFDITSIASRFEAVMQSACEA